MTSASLLPYRYRPLADYASTRIIELQPSESGHNQPEYESISYTWGDMLLTEELIVDDAFLLMITVNLRDALLRFRRHSRVRLLWADAVCINQHDDGDKTTKSPLCRGFTAVPPSFWSGWEVVLNLDVLFCCGPVKVPCTRIVQALRFTKNESRWSVIPSTIRDLWMLRSFDGKASPRFDTVRLLQDLSSAQCSNDRDKVWALSALANDLKIGKGYRLKKFGVAVLDVEYSMGATELYLELAMTVMEMRSESKGLLLVYAGIRSDGQPSSEGLPSWVPDWRLPAIQIPYITSGQEKELHFLNNFDLSSKARSRHMPRQYRDGLNQTSEGCMACEPSQRNDIKLGFKDGARLMPVSWVGEPFPKTPTHFSVAAWVRRSIQDLVFHMQDTLFEGETYEASALHGRAVYLLGHVLATAFNFNGREVEKLQHWYGRISSRHQESNSEVLRNIPEVHFPDHNFLSNRCIFFCKLHPHGFVADIASLFRKPKPKHLVFGVGPDHVKALDFAVIERLAFLWRHNDLDFPDTNLSREPFGDRTRASIWTRKSLIFRGLVPHCHSCHQSKDRHMVVGDILLFSTWHVWDEHFSTKVNSIPPLSLNIG
ncbi:HET-domain-containing protein [Apiospora phragmitis]|uniref:HET-domain-containing protein n=1 Tax=Apiospora phragmitis TaxID=2905665 RepID=A0ABR1US18_9PEZI